MSDKVLLSVRDSDITVRETESVIAHYQREFPDCEVFLDGDLYAIVARPRRSAQ